MEVVRYDAACLAIAAARTFDDVKEIGNRAEAARAYARQAKNRQLELDALEIRTRAERRLGELILDLKQSHILQGDGARENKAERVTLADLGIDGGTSIIAQRLAKIPNPTFLDELSQWRAEAETSTNVKVPLQRFRKPHVVGDRQRHDHKIGRRHIAANPVDRFCNFDGRRVADWRWGELNRIDELAARTRAAVAALHKATPVANPDPLDTIEMIFKEQEIIAALQPIWDLPIPRGDTGIEDHRQAQKRTCASCGVLFKASSGLHRNRPNEGKYCSRKCQHNRSRIECGT